MFKKTIFNKTTLLMHVHQQNNNNKNSNQKNNYPQKMQNKMIKNNMKFTLLKQIKQLTKKKKFRMIIKIN